MPPDSSNSEADEGVGLKLVDDSADAQESEDSPDTSGPTFGAGRSERRGLPVWLFVVALVVSFVVIGWQARIAGELETEIAGLEQEVARTNAQLEAHRSHLAEIRGGIAELSTRLEGLRTLVDADPSDSASGASVTPETILPSPPTP